MMKRVDKAEVQLNQVDFLREDVRFTLFYRIMEGEVIAFQSDDAKAIAMQNPGYNMWFWICENVSKKQTLEYIESLCSQTQQIPLTGINAKPETAEAFAKMYSAATGRSYQTSMVIESYQNLKLTPPEPAVGKQIPAESKHRQELAVFCAGFLADCFGKVVTAESQLESVDRLIQSGNLYVWEADESLVSMTFIAHRSKRHARINYVYTPPEQRGKGYAGNLVAGLCEIIRSESLIPILFADTANPYSNRLYQHLGFESCGRITDISFS